MKITVSIRVRNQDFYEAFEEFKKSQGDLKMSQRDWMVYNDDKIQIHSTYVGFEFNFVVNSFNIKESREYDLEVFSIDEGEKNKPKKNIFHLDNVQIVEFRGDKKNSFVVISNELFHQKIHIENGGSDHKYLYFYLKENTDYNRLSNNIWLSDDKIEAMRNLFGDFAIQNDPNLIMREEGGLF